MSDTKIFLNDMEVTHRKVELWAEVLAGGDEQRPDGDGRYEQGERCPVQQVPDTGDRDKQQVSRHHCIR